MGRKNKIDIKKIKPQHIKKTIKNGVEKTKILNTLILILSEFKKEQRNIQQTIKDKNPELAEIAKSIKAEQHIDSYNLNGTVCSYFLQEYEVRVLEQVYIHCRENGLKRK